MSEQIEQSIQERQLEYISLLPELIFPKMIEGDEKKFLVVFGSRIIARYDTREEADVDRQTKYIGVATALVDGASIIQFVKK
jgi:hypothetical protein